MAVPTAETMVKLEDSREPDLSIVITGYQWKWHYQYQDSDIEFYSSLARSSLDARRKQSGIDPYAIDNYLLEVDNPVVVPRGAKVRLLFTSNDVIHSWWVIDLAIKKDAIPGIVNEAWFRAEEVGTYRGQCAELCGKDHGYMPIVVKVVEPDAFEAWVIPKRHEIRFEAISEAGLAELGALTRRLLTRLEQLCKPPAYNYILRTAPLSPDAFEGFHWRLEITPRLGGLAGFEIGAGMHINPAPPEWAAARWRDDSAPGT